MRGRNMCHRHQRDAEVTVQVHRQANAKAAPGQLLHLPHAAPVVVVAQDNLYCVRVASGISPNEVTAIAGQRRVDAIRQKPAPYLYHAVQSHAGILEIAALGKFLSQVLPTFTGCRPTRHN